MIAGHFLSSLGDTSKLRVVLELPFLHWRLDQWQKKSPPSFRNATGSKATHGCGRILAHFCHALRNNIERLGVLEPPILTPYSRPAGIFRVFNWNGNTRVAKEDFTFPEIIPTYPRMRCRSFDWILIGVKWIWDLKWFKRRRVQTRFRIQESFSCAFKYTI